jgi:hypothetical protein
MGPNSTNSPSGILLEADEIIVKPFEVGRNTLEKERVEVILQRCLASTVRRRICIVEAFCGSVSSHSVGGLTICPGVGTV